MLPLFIGVSLSNPFFFMKKFLKFIFVFIFLDISQTLNSQDIDINDVLERLERIEKNISDLQKGKIENFEKSISSGYISRNESRFDDIETKNRLNYGIIEEIQNKINGLEDKLNLIDSEFQSRVKKIEQEAMDKSNQKAEKSISQGKLNLQKNSFKNDNEKINDKDSNNPIKEVELEKKLSEAEIKKKYENAIKLLWASNYKEAQRELEKLKIYNPKDLMPNIQYWLGEVHYAQKNFEQAIIEFGDGLKNYPESIKGPDNLLKLGLSFSNLKKKNEACNILFELEIKYKDAPKNVIERAETEIKKLDCPEE